METSCIILAGGKSLRLGHDKVLETVGNRSLLEQVVSCVESLCSEVIIVTADERSFPKFSGYPKLKIVTDILPGRGSLGGIYTGLAKSDSFYNLVVACDMPFLNQPLLRYMFNIATDFDFVVPRVNNLLEPLHAIYSQNCLAPAEYILKQGRRVIVELLSMVRVRYVETEEIDRIDPEHLSFFNVNTEDDLILARKLADGECG